MTSTVDLAPPDLDRADLPDAAGATDVADTAGVVGANEAAGIYGLGLPEAAGERLQQTSNCLLVPQASQARLALASTRLPRTRSVASVMEDLGRAHPDLPVLVLAHPGGEAMAVEFLRAGARAVIAEGNEAQIVDWLEEGQTRETLVESFERRLGRRGGDRASTTVIGRSPFESRLHELSQGAGPRIGLIRIVGWDEATSRLSAEALKLLGRRLTVQLQDLCRASEADLEEIGPGEFGLVGIDLPAETADALGAQLSSVAMSFSPGRTSSLGFAMAHVGHEVTPDTSTLLELARRAADLAESLDGPQVVNADEMSHALASTTELDTAFQAIALIERHDPAGEGHGGRVAEIVTLLAEHLGIEGRELVRLRLAANLHDVGKVSLSEPEAYPSPDTPDAGGYRSHPGLGAEALRAAGWEVMSSVRHHHERWDGSGFPDGLAGEEIPLGSRLIAIADAMDRAQRRDEDLEAALEAVEKEAGEAFDPELVRLAVQLLSR